MTKLLLGADPEFFVQKDGKLVSAYGLIEGTKEKPLKVNGGAVQVDGMALEFNIDPASTFVEFNDNINSVLNELRKMVPAEYEFVFKPVAHFGKEYIEAQPEDARRLGCDPDFNAYTGTANVAPDANATFRTASGHIHLGWTEGMDTSNPEHIEACQMMVKQLDGLLGYYSLIYDRDVQRRSLYGKAGAYRPKPYGVEYRTPSNAWVDNVDLRKVVFDAAHSAFNYLMYGVSWSDSQTEVIINTDDWKKAWLKAGRYIIYPRILSRRYDALVSEYEMQLNGTKKGGIVFDPFVKPKAGRKKKAEGVAAGELNIQVGIEEQRANVALVDPMNVRVLPLHVLANEFALQQPEIAWKQGQWQWVPAQLRWVHLDGGGAFNIPIAGGGGGRI